MTTLDTSRELTRDDELEALEALWAEPTASESPRRLRARSKPWAWWRRLLTAWKWYLGFVALSLFFPVEGASQPGWAVWFSTAFLAGLLATFVLAVVNRTSLGSLASAQTALAGIAVAIACRDGGYHAAVFWVPELVGATALVALSGLAFRESRRA